jgi:hypothetical protein
LAAFAHVCLEIASGPWPNSYSDLSPRGGGPTYRRRYGEPNESPPLDKTLSVTAACPLALFIDAWPMAYLNPAEAQRPSASSHRARCLDSMRQSRQAIAALFLTALSPMAASTTGLSISCYISHALLPFTRHLHTNDNTHNYNYTAIHLNTPHHPHPQPSPIHLLHPPHPPHSPP